MRRPTAIQPLVDRILEQHVPATYVREMQSDRGGSRWIEVHLLPHLDADGRAVQGAFVLINDITRHRLAELSVRESEDRLAKFMQASCEGIVFHKDGIITDANPPILALTGYTLDDMLGRKTLDFIAPDEVAKVSSVIASGAGDRLRERRAAQGRHAHRRRVHRAHDDAQRRAAAHDHRARHPRPPCRAGAHPLHGAPRLADRPAQPRCASTSSSSA